MRRAGLALSLVVLVVGIAAGPAAAQGSEEDDALVVLTGRADVAADEEVETVVIFDGPVTVDGAVRQQVVAFNGDVLVRGTVEDDVVSLNGRVTVEAGARVGGDVVSRHDAVLDPEATVVGDVRGFDPDVFDTWFSVVTRLAWWFAISVSALVLGLVLVLLAPRLVEATAAVPRDATGPVIGWGLAALVGGPIVAVVIMVTIVGIPLGLYLLAALGVLSVLGYTASAWILGRAIIRPPRGAVPAFLVGLGILRVVALVPLLGSLVWFVGAVVGTGALLVTAWRARASTAPLGPQQVPEPLVR